MGDNGRLPLPADPALNPALVPGWWLGLEMLITLFTRQGFGHEIRSGGPPSL